MSSYIFNGTIESIETETASNTVDYQIGNTGSYQITGIGPWDTGGNGFAAGGCVQPLAGMDFQFSPPATCKDYHRITPELLQYDGEEVIGLCEVCSARVFIPRVPGAFSFEHAGMLMGRAISLDEDDDEKIAELVAELEVLQEQMDKDIRRYKRAMEVLQIAKSTAKKQLIKSALG